MHKFYAFITFLGLLSFSASAQSPSYVNFEWDVLRFGYSANFQSGESGGLSFGGELRYNATDHFSIGISAEGNILDIDIDDNNGEVGIGSSTLLSGDFYFRNDSPSRAFLGLGLGNFRSDSVTIIDGSTTEIIEGTSGLGIASRAGFEFGHIRLQGQYNITLAEGHADYFSLTVALTLWGGYKGGHANHKSRSERALD